MLPFLALVFLWGWTAPPCHGQDRGRSEATERKPADQSKPLFSGPQKGEPLPSVEVWELQPGDEASRKVDLGAVARQHPTVIVFMHEKSRPAFALGRVLSAFAKRKQQEQLHLYFVVLSDNRSESEKWLKMIRRYFDPSTRLAVAEGGIEGPGALGLNRLVALTILVAKDGTVHENFAFTQVTPAVDAPPVLEAINAITGGGPIPSVQELIPRS
ncbi:MAG: hypothetical protein D6753_12790 [Planctomycetota bacterium]|nr:MAG: hypothetical protein D6753_12790 [Planctomycetota bacterium]